MTAIRKTTGFVLAAAAATMFAAGALTLAPAPAAAEGVKCAGINSCKGHSECATASSSCKGQNACKGQGWTSAESADACTEAGGTVVEG
ncbi:MAG: hypothetical protein WD044_17065 [Dongiaceae bacterium]